MCTWCLVVPAQQYCQPFASISRSKLEVKSSCAAKWNCSLSMHSAGMSVGILEHVLNAQ